MHRTWRQRRKGKCTRERGEKVDEEERRAAESRLTEKKRGRGKRQERLSDANERRPGSCRRWRGEQKRGRCRRGRSCSLQSRKFEKQKDARKAAGVYDFF